MRLSICILIAQSLYAYALPDQPGIRGVENYQPKGKDAIQPDHIVQRREGQRSVIDKNPGLGPEERQPASGIMHSIGYDNPIKRRFAFIGPDQTAGRRSSQPGVKEPFPHGNIDNVNRHDRPHKVQARDIDLTNERRSLQPEAREPRLPITIDGNDNNHEQPHKVHARDSELPIVRREQLPGAEKAPSTERTQLVVDGVTNLNHQDSPKTVYIKPKHIGRRASMPDEELPRSSRPVENRIRPTQRRGLEPTSKDSVSTSPVHRYENPTFNNRQPIHTKERRYFEIATGASP